MVYLVGIDLSFTKYLRIVTVSLGQRDRYWESRGAPAVVSVLEIYLDTLSLPTSRGICVNCASEIVSEMN